MNRLNDHSIPLQDLFRVLNSNGYVLTIEQIIEIQTLLLNFPLMKLSTGDLKYIITPVIAKNDDEQQDAYDIIDSWVAKMTESKAPAPTRIQRWLMKNRRSVWGLKLLVVVALLSLAVWLYLRTTGEPPAQKNLVSKGKLTVDTALLRAADTSTLNPLLHQKGSTQTHPNIPATINNDLDVTYTTDLQQPVPPAKVDNRLPISLVFGFVMGAVLFHFISYEQRKRMELDKRKRTEEALFTVPEDDKLPSHLYSYNEAQRLQQMDLHFSNKEYLIHRPANLQKVKVLLQKPAFVENPPIDIRASIKQSILAAGMATIVSESEWRDRKYILICERKDPDSHISSLLEYVIRQLTATNRNISRYYFTEDVMLLKDVNDRLVPLQQLAHLFPNHHMIVIGNCAAFFNMETLRLKESVSELFQQWESRSIITPLSFSDWSYNEWQLQEAGFQVVPAEMSAIELLTTSITEQAPITKEQLERTLDNTRSAAKYDLRYVDQLKAYLNDEQLFQAVCALAVYPFLKWPITLALFNAFEKARPGFVLNYDNLLKVSRIPWINNSYLDEQVRLQLLDALDLKTELLARETIMKLLEETKPHIERGSSAYTELQVQYNINAFFLYSRDQLQYKQYASVKEVIAYYWQNLDEWALKEHVKRQHSGLVPGNQIKAASAVEEFVVREQLYEKLNFRLKQSAVLLLPAALLFILFTVAKPGIVYMEDIAQKMSITVLVKKEGLCQVHLSAITVSSGILSESKQLNKFRTTDTITVSGIPYRSVVSVQLTTESGRQYSINIPATYSVCHLATTCKVRSK